MRSLLLTTCLGFLISHFGFSAQPNILIILVDDMGYGDPTFNNPESKIPTPHLDQLAAQGMRFTDAHAPGPLCHMSRYGLMTGRAPYRTQVEKWKTHPLIDDDQLTIASLAKSQGYPTAMVGKWHVGFREKGYDKPLRGGPADRGFDSFFGIRASTDIPPYFYIRDHQAVHPPTNTIDANNSEGWSPIQGAFWRKGGISPDLKLDEVLPRFTDEAIKVIQSSINTNHSGKVPWLLYLAYPAPHTPWLPSKEFTGKSQVGMYGDFMMMVDHEIGRVLNALKEEGHENNTLVIFSSDNGPVWYDKDIKKYNHDSSGGLRGMKGDAWEAGHRMPFVARWPDQIKPASTSHHPISFTDFLATFADLFDETLPEDQGPDSFSFLPTLLGEKQTPRPPIVMQPARRQTMTIRDGDWKLITTLGSAGFSKPNHLQPEKDGPTGQLYNLKDDLAETNNLYLDQPKLVQELEAKMNTIINSGRSR